MKTCRLFKFTSVLLLAGLLAGSTGCATRGYHTGERTAANLQSLATKVEMAGRQMDIAVTDSTASSTRRNPTCARSSTGSPLLSGS